MDTSTPLAAEPDVMLVSAILLAALARRTASAAAATLAPVDVEESAR